MYARLAKPKGQRNQHHVRGSEGPWEKSSQRLCSHPAASTPAYKCFPRPSVTGDSLTRPFKPLIPSVCVLTALPTCNFLKILFTCITGSPGKGKSSPPDAGSQAPRSLRGPESLRRHKAREAGRAQHSRGDASGSGKKGC